MSVRTLSAVAALCIAVVVSGCGSAEASDDPSGEQRNDTARAAVRPAGDGREEALASGTLRADPGTGCLWLEGDDGEPGAQLLLLGEDYRVDFSKSPPSVLDGDSVVATVGERVELGGGFRTGLDGVEGCPVGTEGVFLGYFWAVESPALSVEGVTWHLRAVEHRGELTKPRPETDLTLMVVGSAVEGAVRCNTYTTTWAGDGSSVAISDEIWVTAAGCDEPVDPAEVALLEALPRVDDGARDGSRLTLSGPDVELHFELVE